MIPEPHDIGRHGEKAPRRRAPAQVMLGGLAVKYMVALGLGLRVAAEAGRGGIWWSFFPRASHQARKRRTVRS